MASGSMIGGRFRVDRLLGQGGMAEVYGTTDLATGRPTAVKLLKRDVASEGEAVERLKREARVLQSLDHPGIVKLETFGALDDSRIFIAMEWLVGETLGTRLRRVTTLEPEELTPIVTGVCGALEAAHHHGVIHRDLKPDNIFLVQSDSAPVKVLDFGVSKVTGSDQLTATGEVLGTPRYMAPEQLAAERDLDARTDVYALGVLLYEALAGRPPFLATVPTELIVAILHGKAAPLRAYCPNLSEALTAVVTRAMARAREARFPSAAALAAAWGDAVPAAPAVASPRAASTVALGSMSRADLPESSLLAAGPAARPGTFSQFAQAPAMPAAPGRPGLPVPGSAPPIPRTAHQAVNSPAPAVGSSSRAAQTPPREAFSTGPIRLPTHSGRVVLIAVGLLAGMVSAAVAVWALRTFGDSHGFALPPLFHAPLEPEEAPAPALASSPGPAPTVSPIAPSADSAAAPSADSSADSTGETGSGTHEKSVPVLTPESSDPRPVERSVAPPRSSPSKVVRSRRRRARSRSARRVPAMATTTAGQPDSRSARELLREARSLLRQGETERCLELVSRALQRHGGSSALRLQGDCFLRAGKRPEALRAYERFCQLAGDHPAIGEVRGLVESLGGQCR